MKLIEVHVHELPTAINVEYISGFRESKQGGCHIFMTGEMESWHVDETYEQVMKQIWEVESVKTGHWIIHTKGDEKYAECSECHVCGSSRWKVCPVCEAKMEV